MEKLSRLQRLGISQLLTSLKYGTGDISIEKGGFIEFHEQQMVVVGNNGKTYLFEMMDEEEINIDNEYRFQYDPTLKMFRIIDIERKKGKLN